MKYIIILILCIPFNLLSQTVDNYTATVTSTITPYPFLLGDNVQVCITVTDFTEVNNDWLDAIEFDLTGATLVSYDTYPSAATSPSTWGSSADFNDEPAGFIGYSCDRGGNPNQAWNDFGDYQGGVNATWTCCITVNITSVINQLDIYLWSDAQTGSWTSSSGANPDGPFPVFENSSALPVELLSFTGDCKTLSWSTASELNNSHFNIERSYNGEDWEVINVVPGAGNSSNTNYYYSDIYPSKAKQYYRLTQVDYNGETSSSNPIVVYCVSNTPKRIKAIYDSQGKYLGKDFNSLATGMYVILFEDNSVDKFIKQQSPN